MARIRTIKPDFWTDERLTECSLSARLLFIGTWNFADDNGNFPRSSKKIKMQIFPADAIECEPLVIELLTHGLLIEYSVNGEKYLHIKNFKKHQVINRPSKSNIPPVPITEQSHTTHGVFMEDSWTEGKGKEEEGKKKDNPPNPLSASQPKLPPDFSEFWQTYPRNLGSPDTAAKAYELARRHGATHRQIMIGAMGYATIIRQNATDPQYVTQADNWLREKKWLVDYGIPSRGSGYTPMHPGAGG